MNEWATTVEGFEANRLVLAVLALLPAIALLVFIYVKDRVEKEPIGLLLALVGLGALAAVPVLLISEITSPLIDSIFQGFVIEEGGQQYLPSSVWYIYNAVDAFLGVALIEEGCKWLFMFLATRKNKNFNCSFDGIVYAVFVSLGFAALENVLYVFDGGIGVALMRTLTSVPGHMFFGVFMGFYYSMWKVYDTAGRLENAYVQSGALVKKGELINGKSQLALSLVAPVLVHGFYDFCVFVGEPLFTLAFYVALIAMYIFCFKRINTMSRFDGGVEAYAKATVYKKYGIDPATELSAVTATQPEPVNPML